MTVHPALACALLLCGPVLAEHGPGSCPGESASTPLPASGPPPAPIASPGPCPSDLHLLDAPAQTPPMGPTPVPGPEPAPDRSPTPPRGPAPPSSRPAPPRPSENPEPSGTTGFPEGTAPSESSTSSQGTAPSESSTPEPATHRDPPRATATVRAPVPPEPETAPNPVGHFAYEDPARPSPVSRLVGTVSTTVLILLLITTLTLRLTVGWPRFPIRYRGRRRTRSPNTP